MDHQREPPAPGGKEISQRITVLDHPQLRKGAFETNRVSPVEPIATHRYQQIDAGMPRGPCCRPGRMPKQIDAGRIGLARFVDRDQIIAADVAIHGGHRGGGLDRTGDPQQVSARPRPITNSNHRQPFGGTIGIKGTRQSRQMQPSNMPFQEPTLGVHSKPGERDRKSQQVRRGSPDPAETSDLRSRHSPMRPSVGGVARSETGHNSGKKPNYSKSPAGKVKTPPLAVKRNGGAGTEKRPNHLIRS